VRFVVGLILLLLVLERRFPELEISGGKDIIPLFSPL
jgi:hypothetical protein